MLEQGTRRSALTTPPCAQMSTSGGGGGGHKAPHPVLAELRAALLKLEDRLPWTCVTRGFASSRSAWRKDLGHAATLRQFVRSYKEFLPVRCAACRCSVVLR